MPLEEGLLQQQERHQRVCEAAGHSSEEYMKNIQKLYVLALGSPIASSVEYPLWKTRHKLDQDSARGIPPEEDRPPRNILVEDLAQNRKRPPPEEYPLRKSGSSQYSLDKNSGHVAI